jgi:G protein beta subunit-like protein
MPLFLLLHWIVGIEPVSLSSGHSEWVWDCAFSADSAFLLTGSSDQTARLWDLATGQVVCMYTGHGKAVTAVAMNDLVL